jgi:hypothetical protein
MQRQSNCKELYLSPLLIQIANAIASRPEACQVLIQHRLKSFWAHVCVIRTVVSSCCEANALKRCYLSRRCVAHVVQPAVPYSLFSLFNNARGVCANVLPNLILSHCVHCRQPCSCTALTYSSTTTHLLSHVCRQQLQSINKFQQRREWFTSGPNETNIN